MLKVIYWLRRQQPRDAGWALELNQSLEEPINLVTIQETPRPETKKRGEIIPGNPVIFERTSAATNRPVTPPQKPELPVTQSKRTPSVFPAKDPGARIIVTGNTFSIITNPSEPVSVEDTSKPQSIPPDLIIGGLLFASTIPPLLNTSMLL